MLKRVLFFLFVFIFIGARVTEAFKAETFITISNPVRGYDGWSNTKQTPLELPNYIYQESTHSALPVTWLLRYDALESATISGYFKKLIERDNNQSLGAFFEITPSLVNSLGIEYPAGFSVFNANRIFLSGYDDKTREKIIDKYMEAFFGLYGHYPQSVSAWHMDSYSLKYLQEKYSVLTAMNCDDQYSMDHYRLWGGYVGSPYFPDKNNSLVPAKSLNDRVNLAMVRWAPRDLYHFYGSGVSSMYSFQINDYLGLGLDHTYFQKLLNQYSQKDFNEFTHINLGLENDYNILSYKDEIKSVFRELGIKQGLYNLHPISLAQFGGWLKARYPESSPTYFYKTTDTLGASKDEVSWYQSPWYRLGMKSENGKTKILDLRVYNRDIYEDYYNTPNRSTSMYHELPSTIDTVKNPDQVYLLDFEISKSKLVYNKHLDVWKATLVDGNKQLILEPDQITFIGFNPPEVDAKDIKVLDTKSGVVWRMEAFTPFKFEINYFWILVIIYFLYKFTRSQKPPTFCLLLSLLVGVTLYRSGSLNSFGMGFWGPNGHDALFHLSLINHFSNSPFSFSNPQFSGAFLQDYHFVFDYLMGILSRITHTDGQTLYFVIFPILASIVLVRQLATLFEKWGFDNLQKNLAYIFVFLGGSLGFVPRLLTGDSIFSGESIFWANQSASMFLNPPFLLSLVILLTFLNKLHDQRSNIFDLLNLSLLGGLLAQTKVYAYILLLGALLLNKKYKLFIGVFLVGVLITMPFASLSGSPFIFQPLWFIKSLFASFDRVYWAKFVQAWQSYELAGPFYKLFIVNLFAIAAFLLGNLGFRLIGFFDRTQPLAKTIIILGIIIPLLFTQKINPWNTIQFTYYSIFFLGIFAGKVLARYKKFIIPIILLGTLTSIGTLRDYLTHRSSSRISYTELQALYKLRSQPRGLVLSPVFSNNNLDTPKPQYAYVSNAYISALSGQPEFLSDTINLEITGIMYQQRFNEIQKFYNTTDKVWAKKYLSDNKIKYVYETPLRRLTLNPSDLGLSILYDSGEIKVYVYN